MDTQEWQREVSGTLGKIAGTLESIKETLERHELAIDTLKTAHVENRVSAASKRSILGMSAGSGAGVAALAELLWHLLGKSV